MTRLRLAGAAIAFSLATSPAFAWGHYYHFFAHHSYSGGYDHHRLTGPVFPLSRALPNPRLTPGALNPNVTQANIQQTICRRGFTKSIRPPERYTERLKRRGIREYGYKDMRLSWAEEDHLVSLELGGSPDSPRNLWPEPHRVQGGWGSYTKDELENKLNHMVCRGEISLRAAQYQEAHDWIAAYKRYIGPEPRSSQR